jgi:hypothetical protein
MGKRKFIDLGGAYTDEDAESDAVPPWAVFWYGLRSVCIALGAVLLALIRRSGRLPESSLVRPVSRRHHRSTSKS